MLRLLITGGSGLLGSKIAEKALKVGYEVHSCYSRHEVKAGIPVKLDISKRYAVHKISNELRPEIVIHAAALTNIDECEEGKELAWKVNVEGTKNITELSRKHEAF